jgi:periplasmic divalent cation tolerance protein
MSDYLIVLVTAADADEARRLARGLLEQRLAACVNFVPIESMYWWDGVIQQEQETLMIIKTRAETFDALMDAVKRAHSYETPEVIGLPVAFGSPEYLRWIDNETER